MRRLLLRARALVAVVLVGVAGGCADRGLVSGPSEPPGTGTWAAVTIAAAAIAVVLAAHIVVPARGPGGSVLASWVLGLQAGGASVAAAILVGAAIRNDQLVGPADSEQAASLLRLSGLDGGGRLFDLIVAATVILGGLLVATLALAARCAAGDDPRERLAATALLGVEALAALTFAGLVAAGARHAGFVLPALGGPILVAATLASWPRSGPRRSEPNRPG